MRRFLVLLCGLALATIALAAGWLYFFAHNSLPLPVTPFEFTVKPGANLKILSRQLTEAGLLPESQSLWALGRLTQKAGNMQAGTYRLEKAVTPLQLLQKLSDGDVIPITITFVEGITFAEMRAQLEQTEYVKVTLKGLSNADILKRVGASESHPEGLFFPDTYRFVAGTSDLELLKKSYQTMQKKLAEAWAMRSPDLPYSSPYQALIMASLIEKETGDAAERPLIASVFINRLRLPMRLQTDPTIIYGMGASFDGNIRKRDLTTDTPYNTYTRDGLPPTPIAMPGWGSLQAALQPAQTNKLYFVAKGQGSHYFSATLDEHNRAVAKYQLKR
ncbi:MAG: endolytic transglycosylase MltG [Betaproteobacteria bacterium]|nr:endolytic transglycosylase MltG [Betaproteobacteria bacterium]